jgi:hypothetical protein
MYHLDYVWLPRWGDWAVGAEVPRAGPLGRRPVRCCYIGSGSLAMWETSYLRREIRNPRVVGDRSFSLRQTIKKPQGPPSGKPWGLNQSTIAILKLRPSTSQQTGTNDGANHQQSGWFWNCRSRNHEIINPPRSRSGNCSAVDGGCARHRQAKRYIG